MKYLKSLLLVFIPIFILSIIITALYYFDLLNKNVFNWIILIIPIISLFIGGTYLGANTVNHGYLEGIKLGLIIISTFLLASIIAFKTVFSFKQFIYYVIIIISSTLGSMFGINKKKES